MTSVLEEVDLSTIDFGHIECQFDHMHVAVPKACRTCLDEVTHIAETTCGRASMHLCEAAANAMRTFIKAGRVVVCKTCKAPAGTHWTVRPI